MTYDYGKAITAQVTSLRMSAAERSEAIAYMQRGEAIADLILGVARFPRRAMARITRSFETVRS